MFNLRSLVAVLIVVAAAPGASASNVGDSLRYLLDADASLLDRSRALVKVAERNLEHDPAGALAHAVNALRFAEQSGDQRAEHDALVIQREIQLRLGMYPEHLRTTIRALDLAGALSDATCVAGDLQALSTAYRMNRRMDKAVDEARNALAVVTGANDTKGIQFAERFLMQALLDAGRFDEVLRQGEKALHHSDTGVDSTEKARIRLLLASTLLAQGKPNDALPYLTMAERTLRNYGTEEERFHLAIEMSKAAIGMNRLEDARAHLDAAEGLIQSNWSAEEHIQLLEQHYQLAKAKGDWKAALDGQKAWYDRIDSLRSVRKELSLAGMQVMYELDRKDKDNLELRDQNARNEATIAEQRISYQYMLIAAGIFLLLAAALFLISRRSLRIARRSRLKNAVIERQKDEIHAKNLELQRQNLRLAETLMSEEQKDIVIKEIHHRVKNNLQVIDSVLNMQCGGQQDPATARMLKEAQGRLRAMALVHSSIYRSGGEEGIPLRNHMQELARNVLAAHGKHDSISVQVDATDMVLHAQDLMPLSLLVNELLTNAIKYAFPGSGSGQVSIVIRPSGTGYELIFSDNGRGNVEGTTYLRDGSFGMQLIVALAEQLNGEVRILKGTGTSVGLTFFPEGHAHLKAS